MKLLRLSAEAPLLLSVVFALSSSACGESPKEGLEMLSALGVSTDLAPRDDIATNHPLGKEYAVYQKRSELYLSGVRTYDPALGAGFTGKQQILMEDGKAGYGGLFTDGGSEDWNRFRAASTSADVDGDGYDDAVVVYLNTDLDPDHALVRLVHRTTSGYEQTDSTDLGSFTVQNAFGQIDKLQAAAGDLDADGRDEVALVIGNSLVVLDYQAGKLTQVARQDYRNGAPAQVTTVAVGNVDDEPGLEIVVADGINDTPSSTFYVYSIVGGGLVLDAGGGTNVIKETEAGGGKIYEFAAVAIGDVDADNRNEILFAGDVANGSNISLTIMKYQSSSRLFVPVTSKRYAGDWAAQLVPPLAVLNLDGFDGGRQKEILLYNYILHLDGSGVLEEKWAGTRLRMPWCDAFTTGDLNGDGRDEIALLSTDNYNNLFVWGYADGQFKELKSIDIDVLGHQSTLTAVNVDDDSTILHYTGEYELLYSAPQIIAVLASPPYYEGQDLGDIETTFAWSNGTSSETGDSYGFSVGLAVGYHAETPFWGSAGSSEFKVTVETSMDWSFTSTTSETVTKTFSCPGGENQVIFASTPMDVYYYDIVSSPDPAQVGTRISIQVPRRPQILPIDADEFDRIVPAEYRLDPGVLQQHLGDPWTYPTRQDMLALFSDGTIRYDEQGNPYTSVIPVSATQGGFRTPDAFMIDVGKNAGGTQSLEIEKGVEKGYGFDFNLSVGVEFETVSGGFLLGGSAGFDYGYSQNFTSSESTIIGGSVPNIPASMSDEKAYSTGLFAYPYPSPASGPSKFLVVHYWVEDKAI